MAEASEMSKVDDIITCAICLEVLSDPKTFQCLHSYCTKCVRGLQITQLDAQNGYECPECRQFTPENEVKAVHLVTQLLDAYSISQVTEKTPKCKRCTSEDAKWCCMDCKTRPMLCTKCKKDHNYFVDGHQILTTDDLKDARYILDRPLHCTEHDKLIEVYCVDCKKTLCVLCKIFNHDDHKAEPIQDALQRISPEVKTSAEKIEGNITVHEDRIAVTKAQKEDAIKQVTKQFDMEIEEQENLVNEQKQVLTWVKTAVSKTKGVTLLHQLQAGLFEKAKQLASNPVYGNVHEPFRVQASRCWPWKTTATAPTLQNTQALPNNGGTHPYTRIAVLWDMILVINHGTRQVYKFNFDGTEVGESTLSQDIAVPRTAVQLDSARSVLAAQSGLYIINKEGQSIETIHQADFSDVSIDHDGIVNALEHNEGKVYRFQQFGTLWRKHDEVDLDNYKNENANSGAHNVNTFLVREKRIYVCMTHTHRIVLYDTSGKKLHEIASTLNNLSHPSICGMSSDSKLVIANYGNSRIYHLGINGITEEIFSPGFATWFATYQNETTLWMLDNSTCQLKRYVYETE